MMILQEKQINLGIYLRLKSSRPIINIRLDLQTYMWKVFTNSGVGIWYELL